MTCNTVLARQRSILRSGIYAARAHGTIFLVVEPCIERGMEAVHGQQTCAQKNPDAADSSLSGGTLLARQNSECIRVVAWRAHERCASGTVAHAALHANQPTRPLWLYLGQRATTRVRAACICSVTEHCKVAARIRRRHAVCGRHMHQIIWCATTLARRDVCLVGGKLTWTLSVLLLAWGGLLLCGEVVHDCCALLDAAQRRLQIINSTRVAQDQVAQPLVRLHAKRDGGGEEGDEVQAARGASAELERAAKKCGQDAAQPEQAKRLRCLRTDC